MTLPNRLKGVAAPGERCAPAGAYSLTAGVETTTTGTVRRRTWDVKDRVLPQPVAIDDFDVFDPWPDGDCQKIYRLTTRSDQTLEPSEPLMSAAAAASSESGEAAAAARHWTGWAMRNTNNHNPTVLKKSCLGLLVCSNAGCSGGVRIRPAICDKARSKQLGRQCPTAGCSGKLELRRCRGNRNFPVTHFWRTEGTAIYFQAKGKHDHPQPVLSWAERLSSVTSTTVAEATSERDVLTQSVADDPSRCDVMIYEDPLTTPAKAVKTEVGGFSSRQPMCLNGSTACQLSAPCKEPWVKGEIGYKFGMGHSAALPNVEETAGDSSWTMTATNGMTYMVEMPKKKATDWNSTGGNSGTWYNMLQYSGYQENDPHMNAGMSNAVFDYVSERKPAGYESRLLVECDVEMTSHAAATHTADAAYCEVTTYPSPPLNHYSSYAAFSASDATWMHRGCENWSCDDNHSFYSDNAAYATHCVHPYSQVATSVHNQPMLLSTDVIIDDGLAVLASMAGDPMRNNNYY